jgi:hypothetical protein
LPILGGAIIIAQTDWRLSGEWIRNCNCRFGCPVRFQRAADQRLVQGASRDARPAGSFALGELFPGFEQNLARAGAVPLRVAVDVRMELPGFDPLPPRDLGWDVYSMSRPLIERVVRQCVQQHSNITFRKRCRVRELVASADRATVTGVRYKNGDGNDETLSADLIVDASGRSVLALSLLEAIGQPQPEETLIWRQHRLTRSPRGATGPHWAGTVCQEVLHCAIYG